MIFLVKEASESRLLRQRPLSRKTLLIPVNGSLKVPKHEIILNFFLPKSNPYVPFVNFRKQFRFFSFDFRKNFDD
jgi:hypothetical protein